MHGADPSDQVHGNDEALARRPLDGLSSLHIQKPNLKEVAANIIRELIYSGQLKPSQRIDQKTIASNFGISKLPVREALIALESEGLVKNVPRYGAYVSALSPSDIRDHYSIFGIVSATAAESAISQIDGADLTALEEIVVTMETNSDADELEELNFRFHQRINHIGSSRRLRVVLKNLAQGLPPRTYANNPGWAKIAVDDHRAIFNGLRNHDRRATRLATESHFSKCADYVVDFLETREFWHGTQ